MRRNSASDKRIPERTEKARSLGHPPEWLEVGAGSAERLLAFVLDLQGLPGRFEDRADELLQLLDFILIVLSLAPSFQERH
jgi:hypothetical protein